MYYFVGLIVALACFANTNFDLVVQAQETVRCVSVPADQGLLAVAAQSDSPLIFEDTKLFTCLDSRTIKSYKLRNRGAKPIRSFTVAGWSIGGGGFKWGWGGRTPDEVIMPGQLAPMKEEEIKVVPLTTEIRHELKLEGPMQGLIVLMVVNVEYADGTSYNAAEASEALERYFEKMGN